jgi:hypothetical protein
MFAEGRRRDTKTRRKAGGQGLGEDHLLDSLPSARRWQVVGFLWSHTGKPRSLQELLSGPEAESPTGAGLGIGER